jgi:hypothetical protein
VGLFPQHPHLWGQAADGVRWLALALARCGVALGDVQMQAGAIATTHSHSVAGLTGDRAARVTTCPRRPSPLLEAGEGGDLLWLPAANGAWLGTVYFSRTSS